jgi:hypothetical protein
VYFFLDALFAFFANFDRKQGLKVSEKGKKRIEKEVHDVKKIVDKEARVSDQKLVYIWLKLLEYRQTQRGRELERKGIELAYSDQSKKIAGEVQEVVKDLKRDVKVSDLSFEIDNEDAIKIGKKLDKMNNDYEELKKTKEFRELKDKLREER